ncbi:class I SAM-dependent methyltransferase [Amycolatopsis sp. NBC_00438]|uniref:class I SAM-dependent methyltransferase n=1 Tax=Amycolatopsis sp. NBC_00438 TaxID=2903558 RepID=UPI002E1A1912
MTEQIRHWDDLHNGGEIGKTPGGPSSLAMEAARSLPVPSRVLELGCGSGADAAYLAAEGHDVLALDFSAVAIRRAASVHADVGVDFRVADFSRPLDLRPESFDLVYARLSMHYFPDSVTRELVGEVARLLAEEGRLVALCKSVADPLCGKGSRIEDDMYRLDGHVRHFFSAGYMRELLGSGFRPARVTEFEGVAYGRNSAFVKVFAQRK